MSTFSFQDLSNADLIVDALYEGGNTGNVSDDPINKLIPGVGNQGGFRRHTNRKTGEDVFCVLYSSSIDPDWPDTLNLPNGLFIYYGDNKKPGRQLEDTRPGGNRLLRLAFEKTHGKKHDRLMVPPFFIFTKGLKGRDVIFRGLAVPGSKIISQNEDLMAIWKIKDGQRFQNYKATFTILNVACVDRVKYPIIEDIILEISNQRIPLVAS